MHYSVRRVFFLFLIFRSILLCFERAILDKIRIVLNQFIYFRFDSGGLIENESKFAQNFVFTKSRNEKVKFSIQYLDLHRNDGQKNASISPKYQTQNYCIQETNMFTLHQITFRSVALNAALFISESSRKLHFVVPIGIVVLKCSNRCFGSNKQNERKSMANGKYVGISTEHQSWSSVQWIFISVDLAWSHSFRTTLLIRSLIRINFKGAIMPSADMRFFQRKIDCLNMSAMSSDELRPTVIHRSPYTVQSAPISSSNIVDDAISNRNQMQSKIVLRVAMVKTDFKNGIPSIVSEISSL